MVNCNEVNHCVHVIPCNMYKYYNDANSIIYVTNIAQWLILENTYSFIKFLKYILSEYLSSFRLTKIFLNLNHYVAYQSGD